MHRESCKMMNLLPILTGIQFSTFDRKEPLTMNLAAEKNWRS